MDKDGDGALVQPILAYGYTGSHYTIFNGVFDWTDGSWHTSQEKYTVQPGDLITSSVVYNAAADSYTMRISSDELGKTISTAYAIEKRQTKVESAAVFVLEHQPRQCKAYPTSGEMTFKSIVVEVEGKLISKPDWRALQERPGGRSTRTRARPPFLLTCILPTPLYSACNSKAEVVDASTIKFSWDTKAAQTVQVEQTTKMTPAKWGGELSASAA